MGVTIIHIGCDEGSVSLIGGSTEREGTVLVCYNGQWGSICDNTFNPFDGRVVCTQLGFSNSMLGAAVDDHNGSFILLYC